MIELYAPSEIEIPILRVLYPPDGSIPAAHVERVPEIRQHISALMVLASGGTVPKCSRRVLDPDESAALNAKILELRETPLPDGGVRTWDQISEVLGRQITALAARKRYAAAKKVERELSERGIPEGIQYTTPSHSKPLSSVETILELAKNAAMNREILLPVANKEESSPNPIKDIEKLRIAAKPPGNPGQAPAGNPSKSPNSSSQSETPAPMEPKVSPEPNELRPEVEPEQKPESSPPGYLESSQIKEPSPPTEAEIDAELIRLRDMGLSPKEIQNSMLHKGVDFGLAELRDRLAALAKKALLGKAGPCQLSGLPSDAIPPGLNRTGLDTVIWRLWDHGKGKTPDEISDLLCKYGYSYGRKQVERRLEQQGANL